MEILSAFQINEVTGIYKRFFGGTRNKVRKYTAVFRRYQHVKLCREDQCGNLYVADAFALGERRNVAAFDW